MPSSKRKGGKKGGKDTKYAHLFSKNARQFKIGRDVRPSTDLSRCVKWPRYVRVQRQRAILKERIKIPPALNQFTRTVEQSQARTLFSLLSHYRPESPSDKKDRLKAIATAKASGNPAPESKKVKQIKYGLQHVTDLIESKKAKLVVISHDVDPIELVVWLPALCRKMDVPYCIVKSKARLGRLVYKKTATAICLTEVNKEDESKLQQLISSFRLSYNDSTEHTKWGDGKLGWKSTKRQAKLAAAAARAEGKSKF